MGEIRLAKSKQVADSAGGGAGLCIKTDEPKSRH